ncbi:A/G-specific adenine glycosylase [Sulfoacidibacillus thermotolerans]|uniref:Adenine DNA glycosylase n=1 Tax=Sulfoacidibacillus thermotolerans TaxID=1765684 RepID=A0A2U3D9Z9_SULT2|nr:A/G-specific adenine glycosylase [Sulfoacidibacillus thermotolerans]PWI58114.1 A/G-specific adenine glycosylase [Sulfoacidibacillus thermotolerans]
MAKQEFASALVQWYRTVQRDLPWRRSKDPYAIWVSEVMLQQTRVETVVPYFERFITRYPSIDALAAADEQEVVKNWEGLGYYSRVRNLHLAVKEVASKYGGEIPRSYEQMRALPGVGPYTVGAVLSIAYGVPLPAVDGNVLRVMARVFALEEDVASARTRTRVEAIVTELIPRDCPGDFNQALMELGARICVPRTPKCVECPLTIYCKARATGRQNELPYKKGKKPQRIEERAVFLIESQSGEFLIRKRPQQGLLANLWEFPHVLMSSAVALEVDASDLRQIGMLAREIVGYVPQEITFIRKYVHLFSHVIWNLSLYVFKATEGLVLEAPYQWVSAEQRERYTFGQVFNKMWMDVKVEGMSERR